jgi:hypothetical protein
MRIQAQPGPLLSRTDGRLHVAQWVLRRERQYAGEDFEMDRVLPASILASIVIDQPIQGRYVGPPVVIAGAALLRHHVSAAIALVLAWHPA